MPPLVRCLGSEDPQRRARDEMALEVEGVVNGGVHAEKTMDGTSRLEPLHFALASSHRLMRVLRPIVLSLICPSAAEERRGNRLDPDGYPRAPPV